MRPWNLFQTNVPVSLHPVLLPSILTAMGNQVAYKKTLNSFSTPTHSYVFFVNQWSLVMYLVQAFVVVGYNYFVTKDITRADLRKVEQKVFLMMGFLDSFAGVLSAIGGAFCPGPCYVPKHRKASIGPLSPFPFLLHCRPFFVRF